MSAVPSLLLLVLAGCAEPTLEVALAVSAEDRRPDGSRFTPSTQSLVRGHHWLEGARALRLAPDGGELRVAIVHDDDTHFLHTSGIPIDMLLPVLPYDPAAPPDAFDAFNLRMAEYSRNAVGLPHGTSADAMVHFESSFTDTAPWTVDAPFAFTPNPVVRPLRFHVVNNCLQPGLWEVAATDRAGEVFHAWAELDADPYRSWVADENGVPEPFVADALAWSTTSVPVVLDRLRVVVDLVADATPVGVVARDVGYSTQDSRRKLTKGFVKVQTAAGWTTPTHGAQLHELPVGLAEFAPPGTYQIDADKPFRFDYLARVRTAAVRTVRPTTRWRPHTATAHADALHLEWTFDLGDRSLVVGNLPVPLLVQQEDFVLHGFGVGIVASAEPVERRKLLFERGHAPSYAYLLDADGLAVNSHDLGLEQLVIRTLVRDGTPAWELTLTSYERMVDLVTWRLPIPEALVGATRAATDGYVTPSWLHYTDPNTR